DNHALFFQAEDGIRYFHVTGVQTCALPIFEDKARELKTRKVQQLGELVIATGADAHSADELAGALVALAEIKDAGKREAWAKRRSEERRVERVEISKERER